MGQICQQTFLNRETGKSKHMSKYNAEGNNNQNSQDWWSLIEYINISYVK